MPTVPEQLAKDILTDVETRYSSFVTEELEKRKIRIGKERSSSWQLGYDMFYSIFLQPEEWGMVCDKAYSEASKIATQINRERNLQNSYQLRVRRIGTPVIRSQGFPFMTDLRSGKQPYETVPRDIKISFYLPHDISY